MALKIIAVDTSQVASYSCTAFGYEMEISRLHNEISKAMFGKKRLHTALDKNQQKNQEEGAEKSF